MAAQDTTAARATSLEEARVAAKDDKAVLDAGGFVIAKYGDGYGFLPTPNPGGLMTADAGGAEIIERVAWRGGDWKKVGAEESSGHLARERMPETETGSAPP